MTILITGGGGFIGAYLARALAEDHVRVRVMHRSHESLERSKHLTPQAEQVIADVTDDAAIRRALKGVDTVYHLAGFGSPGSSHTDDLEILRVNVSGTCTVLREAAAADVRRVVFASSASVYGDSPESPKTESMPSLPKSVYAASKTAAEDLCLVFHSQRGLDTRILRFFNVYGAGQASNMVIPRFIDLLAHGKPVTLFGDGAQIRDFVHVDDVVAALMMAGTIQTLDAPVLNIGSGSPTSIRAIVDTIAGLLDVRPEIELLLERPGEIRESVADIQAARSHLGFSPHIDVAQGLAMTCPSPVGMDGKR